MPSLVEIDPDVLEKKLKMWKVYDNNNDANDDGQGTNLNRKAHFGSGDLKTCTCECLFIFQKFSETSKIYLSKCFTPFMSFLFGMTGIWALYLIWTNFSFLNQAYRYCASSLKKSVTWFLLQSLSVESLKRSVRVERETTSEYEPINRCSQKLACNFGPDELSNQIFSTRGL